MCVYSSLYIYVYVCVCCGGWGGGSKTDCDLSSLLTQARRVDTCALRYVYFNGLNLSLHAPALGKADVQKRGMHNHRNSG